MSNTTGGGRKPARLGRSLAKIDETLAEQYRKRDGRIIAYCGTPDAAEGCRKILHELENQALHDRIAELEVENASLRDRFQKAGQVMDRLLAKLQKVEG